MRKIVIVLAIVLSISIGFNVFLFIRTGVLDRAYQRSEAWLRSRGDFQGAEDAKKDFAAGTPKWYVIGDFGGPVPADKPGRTLATVGCLVSEYERAYVLSYNDTMDQLFENRLNDTEAQQPLGLPDVP